MNLTTPAPQDCSGLGCVEDAAQGLAHNGSQTKFISVPVVAAALAQPQMLAGPGPQVQALAATPRPQTAMELKSKSVVKAFVALHPQTTGRFPCIAR